MRFEDYLIPKSDGTIASSGITGVSYGKKICTVKCPACSSEREGKNKNAKCLTVWVNKGTYHCNHCGVHGSIGFEQRNKPSFNELNVVSVEPTDKMYNHFAFTRKIPKDIITRNRIGAKEMKDGKLAICFNYYVEEKLVAVKYKTGDKKFWQEKESSQVFYKLDDLDGQTTAIITEGEEDALSFEVAGFLNAISVPLGAPNANDKIDKRFQFLDNCIDYLEAIETFYIAVDQDDNGETLRQELVRRLGKSKCRIIRFPSDCKDANDTLVKYGVATLRECYDNAEFIPLEGIFGLEDSEEALDYIRQHGYPNGATTGHKNFDEHLEWHLGTLNIVTGRSATGKSSFLDDCLIRLCVNHGWKIGYFSPESYPAQAHWERLIQILIGKPVQKKWNGHMGDSQYDKAKNWLRERIFRVHPENDKFTLERILENFKHLVKSKGIKVCVIDPWNTIQPTSGGLNTDEIANILNKLKYFARENDVCMVLVAHPTKIPPDFKTNKRRRVTLEDIAGSVHFFNICDVGIVVHREKDEDTGLWDNYVSIDKIKFSWMGKTGKIEFDYDVTNNRYRERDVLANSYSLVEELAENQQYKLTQISQLAAENPF